MDRENKTAAKLPPNGGENFVKDEDGTILFFAVIMLIVMFMVGGMGIDIMRFESTRTDLQQTADRASLAAASFSQKKDATALVTDYFVKAGLGSKLSHVEVTGGTLATGLNFKRVRIEARANTNPIFLRLYDHLGTNQIEARALSVAEQRISNVEIALVLDVSGSMGGRKLADLKSAATEFIDTMLVPDVENKISIAIVPYNAQVNIPTILKDQFTFTNDNGTQYARCVELPQAAFNSGPISRTTSYPLMAYSDIVNGTYNSNWYSTDYSDMYQYSAYCLDQAQNVIMLPERNINSLKAKINSLTAGGNTSSVLGMKWGVTLLDPSMKSAYTNFITANAIPNQLAGRPYTFGEEDTMKVIVLMTDGEHVQHSYVPDAYKTGDSPIWKGADGNYSIKHTSGRPSSAGTNTFYVPHLNAWQSTAWGGATATQQKWQDVWKEKRMTWVAWQLYARALGTSDSTRSSVYNTWRGNFQDYWLNASQMDSALQSTCNYATDNKVLVYGIAFEAPTAAAEQIRQCSTDDGHFYNAADGIDFKSAFRSIATNISQLRLLQ